MNIRSAPARRRLLAGAALAAAGWLALGAASAAADTSAHRPLGTAGAHIDGHVVSGNGSGRGSGPSSGSGATAGPRQQPPARGPVIKVSKGARWS